MALEQSTHAFILSSPDRVPCRLRVAKSSRIDSGHFGCNHRAKAAPSRSRSATSRARAQCRIEANSICKASLNPLLNWRILSVSPIFLAIYGKTGRADRSEKTGWAKLYTAREPDVRPAIRRVLPVMSKLMIGQGSRCFFVKTSAGRRKVSDRGRPGLYAIGNRREPGNLRFQSRELTANEP
jgi:hypothetical protein